MYVYSTQMSSPILYEHPLNERIRVFLRLEHFFSNFQHFLSGHAPFDTHSGILTFLEILTILERVDARSEILKELERHTQGLARLYDTPGVDSTQLDTILDTLAFQIQQLQRLPNKLGLEAKESELLNSIRQRTSIAAGTCGFDLPAYHYLLNQPSEIRQDLLGRWQADFVPLQQGIDLLLSLLRDSAFFEHETAEQGFYQKVLDPQNPCQLLRIALPADCPIYPEVSGSKYRVNIRFLTFSETERPKQIAEPQAFDISCCLI